MNLFTKVKIIENQGGHIICERGMSKLYLERSICKSYVNYAHEYYWGRLQRLNISRQKEQNSRGQVNQGWYSLQLDVFLWRSWRLHDLSTYTGTIRITQFIPDYHAYWNQVNLMVYLIFFFTQCIADESATYKVISC